MHLSVLGIVLGQPLGLYSYLVLAVLVASSVAYWHTIRRFINRKAAKKGAAVIAMGLSFEIAFLCLVLGILGLFLFIILEFCTGYYIKKKHEDVKLNNLVGNKNAKS